MDHKRSLCREFSYSPPQFYFYHIFILNPPIFYFILFSSDRYYFINTCMLFSYYSLLFFTNTYYFIIFTNISFISKSECFLVEQRNTTTTNPAIHLQLSPGVGIRIFVYFISSITFIIMFLYHYYSY